MSDIYVECLVKGKKSRAATAGMVLLLALTVLSAIGMFLMPFLMVLAIACGIGAYFVSLYSQVEYEYLYLDKEISVDKIYGQTKRKKAAVYSVERMEIFAPVTSWHLDAFRNRQVKEIDYAKAKAEQPDTRYVMYYEGNIRVLFSPSEDMVKALKNVAPRKVFTD